MSMAEPHLDPAQGRTAAGGPGLVAALPALAAIEVRLRAGARVAEVGCGDGRQLVELARTYPSSTFHGFGDDRDRIAAARVAAAEAGVSDRVTFERAPADRFPGTRYDLVCTFGALEQLGEPAAILGRIREVLAPRGTWLLIERARTGRA
jgi:cyclopropane fatty-acyl-phospholipid synthase-like methyltransferase